MNSSQHTNPGKSILDHQIFQWPRHSHLRSAQVVMGVRFNSLPRLFENEFILPAATQLLLPNKEHYLIITKD